MSCKNCPENIHPLFIIFAIIVWLAIVAGIVAFVMWVGWVIIFWSVVLALCIAFGVAAGRADEWYKQYKG